MRGNIDGLSARRSRVILNVGVAAEIVVEKIRRRVERVVVRFRVRWSCRDLDWESNL